MPELPEAPDSTACHIGVQALRTARDMHTIGFFSDEMPATILDDLVGLYRQATPAQMRSAINMLAGLYARTVVELAGPAELHRHVDHIAEFIESLHGPCPTGADQ